MNYLGEFIAISTALTWTATAIFAEVASKRIGPLQLNVIRMVLSIILLSLTLLIFTGAPYPLYTNHSVWFWLSLSGFVGYVFGDYCLFNSYVIIGSRFGQLFMTLAPLFAALFGFILLSESLSLNALLGMVITLFGIEVSVFNKRNKKNHNSVLPTKGIMYGIGAALGQGVGLVLSKIGMDYYKESIPSEMTNVIAILPFTATLIRAITGLIGFLVIMFFQKKFTLLVSVLRDRKGMNAAFWSTFTGPFIGVSLSLMAIQYISTGIASTLMALTPIFILWPAHILFKQTITFKEVIGACISVFGTSLFFI